MACTLIVDASYCESGAAGWAGWVKADHGVPHLQGGIIEALVVHKNHEAELAACFYGLSLAGKHAPGHDVLLQSDCLRALQVLRNELGFEDRPHRDGTSVHLWTLTHSGVERRICAAIRTLLARQPVRVQVRHVKGHVRHAGGRHAVNEACDRLAKRYMREARGGAHKKRIEVLADAVAAYRPDGVQGESYETARFEHG